MKESFERLVAWAKEHPWITALILGGVALLAYLTYKNGWFGTGSGGSSASTVPDSSTVAAGMDTSGAGVGTIAPADLSNLGSSIAPAPSQIPNYTVPGMTGGGGGSGYNPGGGVGFTDNLSSLFGSPAPTVPANIAGTAAPVQSVAQPIQALVSGSPLVSQNSAALIGAQNLPTELQPQGVKAPSTGLVMPTSAAKQAAQSTGHSLTPSQLIGKGRLFSGTVNGVQYVSGYPVGYGGYNQQGGYTYVIPTPQGPVANVVSQQLLNYGATTSQTLNQPGTTQNPAVLHGH